MIPIQVTLCDIPNSPFLENHIREKAEKLQKFYHRINRCRVVVKVPQKHKHQGKLYSVHVDLTVPGKELVVNKKINEDVYVAIRDAFTASERQLDKYARRQRGDIKNHEFIYHGYISRIFYDDGYGFIEGIDGDEFYFSSENVAFPKFNKLMIGDQVQFLSVSAGDGLQANRVKKEKE